MDFTALLTELIRLDDAAALYEGVKALRGCKSAENFSDGEWAALEQIRGSQRHTAVGRLTDSLLRHRPHTYVAEWN